MKRTMQKYPRNDLTSHPINRADTGFFGDNSMESSRCQAYSFFLFCLSVFTAACKVVCDRIQGAVIEICLGLTGDMDGPRRG